MFLPEGVAPASGVRCSKSVNTTILLSSSRKVVLVYHVWSSSDTFAKGTHIDSPMKLTSILFPQPPNQTNKMQRFLGSAVYFKPFIENYSQCVAPLHHTTKETFDWNEKTWTVDYRAVFERF